MLIAKGRDRPRNWLLAVRQWTVTLVATGLSMYMLDIMAAAAGVALAASGVLAGLGHQSLLIVLALTYIAWGAGLRVNLHANWSLLTTTGVSTNVLSKIAFDVVGRLTHSPLGPRIAASVGYTLTELAKELPYYVGAFGTAVVTDSVSAHDALVFLAGANLGAACYEYGVARLTGMWLRRRVVRCDPRGLTGSGQGCRTDLRRRTAAGSRP